MIHSEVAQSAVALGVRRPIVPTRQRCANVSVVVCAYTADRWDDLFAAVMSVRAQTVQPREIIIAIDNNPELALSVRGALPEVLVLENTGSRGAGQTRNVGVAAANGSIIGFLDDDARADRRWIEHAMSAFHDSDVIGVGGTIDPDWEGGLPRWIAQEFYWTVGCSYPGLPTTPEPVRNLIAANMFVRREAFLALGGFRSGFGKTGARSGAEETEFCIRARQRWARGVWLHDPRVRVSHRVPRNRARLRYFVERCYDEGVVKASIVGLLGGQDGLAAERSYTLRVLPLGVIRGFGSAVRSADLTGVARSLSIVLGLSATISGYAVGRLTQSAVRAPDLLASDQTEV
jgi:glycosyltransferase involved in cell wall biosynthesis